MSFEHKLASLAKSFVSQTQAPFKRLTGGEMVVVFLVVVHHVSLRVGCWCQWSLTCSVLQVSHHKLSRAANLFVDLASDMKVPKDKWCAFSRLAICCVWCMLYPLIDVTVAWRRPLLVFSSPAVTYEIRYHIIILQNTIAVLSSAQVIITDKARSSYDLYALIWFVVVVIIAACSLFVEPFLGSEFRFGLLLSI